MTDLTITAADVLVGSVADVTTGTAGSTITAGQWLYVDSSDGDSVKPADCTAEASAECVGVALHGALTGQPIRYQTAGNLDCGGTTVVGTVYVLSEAGAIAPYGDLSQDDFVTLLGIGLSATNLRMAINISGVQVP